MDAQQPQEPQQEETLEVTGPGGLKAILRTANSSAVLLLVLSGLFFYISQNGETQAAERAKATNAAIADLKKELAESRKIQEQSTAVLIYVLSLTPEEREKLNLQKPQYLREMQR